MHRGVSIHTCTNAHCSHLSTHTQCSVYAIVVFVTECKEQGVFNQHSFGLLFISFTCSIQSLVGLVLIIYHHSNISQEVFLRSGHRMADKRGDVFWEERLSVCSYCVRQRLGLEDVGRVKSGAWREVCV